MVSRWQVLKCFFLAIVLGIPAFLGAQSITDPLLLDALRYQAPIRGAGPVAVSMGFATITSDQDPSAWFLNPASLGLHKNTIVDLGFRFRNGSVSSSFLGTDTDQPNTSSDIDHFFFIYPYPVLQGSFVLGFGYGQYSLFDLTASGEGFNPTSSYSESFYGYNPSARFATGTAAITELTRLVNQDDYFYRAQAAGLYYILTDPADPAQYRIRSAAIGRVTQSYTALFDGSLYAWTVGASAEVAQGIFLGASIQVLGGFYLKDYEYSEQSDLDWYRQYPDSGRTQSSTLYIFKSLTQSEKQDDDISGLAFRFGGVAKLTDEWRVGFAYALPTQLSVKSSFEWDIFAEWEKNGNPSELVTTGANQILSIPTDYELSGPSILDGSVGFQSFPFSAEVGFTWTDYSAMRYSNTSDDEFFDDLNREIKLSLDQTLDYRAGIQYAVPEFQSLLRAGINSAGNPAGGDRRNQYSLGYEYVTEGGYRFVLGYQLYSFEQEYLAYQPVAKPAVSYTENEVIHTFSIGTIIRF